MLWNGDSLVIRTGHTEAVPGNPPDRRGRKGGVKREGGLRKKQGSCHSQKKNGLEGVCPRLR